MQNKVERHTSSQNKICSGMNAINIIIYLFKIISRVFISLKTWCYSTLSSQNTMHNIVGFTPPSQNPPQTTHPPENPPPIQPLEHHYPPHVLSKSHAHATPSASKFTTYTTSRASFSTMLSPPHTTTIPQN
jgi:hypothetical protein